MTDKATSTIEKLEKMRGRRMTHDTLWQEIADYMLPSRSFTVERMQGEKRTSKIFDSTAPLALGWFAGNALQSCNQMVRAPP